MITADVVALIALLCCLVFGSAFGFGKGLRFFTGGVFGRIIAVVICYFLFGVVLNWGFVQTLLTKFTDMLSENGSWICNFLLNIRIDLIVFGFALFVVVQILHRLVVCIVSNVMEIKNKAISVINRILGIALFVAFAVISMLIVFQVIAWVSGTDGEFYMNLQGSVFGLDKLFVQNPLNSVFENIRVTPSEIPAGE